MSDDLVRKLWRAHLEYPTAENYVAWAREAARAGMPHGLDLVRADVRWERASERSRNLSRTHENWPPGETAEGIAWSLYHRGRSALRSLDRLGFIPRCNLPGGLLFHLAVIRRQEANDRRNRRTRPARPPVASDPPPTPPREPGNVETLCGRSTRRGSARGSEGDLPCRLPRRHDGEHSHQRCDSIGPGGPGIGERCWLAAGHTRIHRRTSADQSRPPTVISWDAPGTGHMAGRVDEDGTLSFDVRWPRRAGERP